MRKICFFTGTRAEYGVMSRLMRKVADASDCQIQIIATNMHLSPEFGLTYKEIEKDGFKIDKKVEMLLSSDTCNGTVKSMGLGTIGFADALEELRPDMAVILGDRYEMLVAAQVCLIYRIPIAHLYGGEITEGAYDDCIRHAITKMSHLHFTSTEENRERVIQMGEKPEHVFWAGSLGAENIANEEIMSLQELEDSLNIKLGKKFLLVTFHPVTLEGNTAENQCCNLLAALSELNSQYKLLFTLPNSDTDGRIIISLINDFVAQNKSERFSFVSLGKKRYYSALSYCSVVIGNSSSGLAEAPSFHKATLNIGNRQKGRTRAASIVDCDTTVASIRQGLRKVLSVEMEAIAKDVVNPYYKENSLQCIFDVIRSYPLNNLVLKTFYNIRTK